MTMYDARTNLSQQVVNEVRRISPACISDGYPVQSVWKPELRQADHQYEPNGAGAIAYRALAEEFVQRETGQIKFVNGSTAN